MPFDAQAPYLSTAATPTGQSRAVAYWLLAVALMVWAMVAIGGATRLTGSGLSIMEWAPLSGTLPPMSEAEWNRLYDLYRTIPQYELVNRGFGLEGFKGIFWLEWIHRFWGRLLGLVYAGGLIWFWLRGGIPKGYGKHLLLLLVLGGLQGVVGWFMVASGFEADRTAVSPWRLVIHLGLALLLFAMLLWTALSLLRPERNAPPEAKALRPLAHATAGLMVLTMVAGGFVAGIKAGLDYNTFPLMGGRIIPEGYGALTPFAQNFVANVAAVQFNHRLLATLAGLAALALGWLALRRLPAGVARKAAIGFVGVVMVQYGLGVATLLHVVPVWLGTLHQTVAVGVLGAALILLHALRRPRQHPPT
ncbi:COX15/CtaA family protein [Roseomonas xinghualingensis]|uniref:COX15/CtaA family protein n=1 Tax=Roseomonas xinghualingensis TaxID=2986475 RepID=UPI0021F1CC2A|nr:COX15/CtaA family protein [Roseomonas sp. SXEYE001]MCV4208808.1 COX15/CtaA family protein [Roseomonas sp. SXEYE001]